MPKKVNECPECQFIEDDQYTCTTCWGQGGIHMYDDDPDDEQPLYGRSHEECDECANELVEPQPCPGHPAGPVSCSFFIPKLSEDPN